MAEETTESVWEFPRPPRLERTGRRLRVEHRGHVVAETEHGWRVLETSHPPVYYFPRVDVRWEMLAPSAARGSLCEWKGVAQYVDLVMPGTARVVGVGWIYPRPTEAFQEIGGRASSLRKQGGGVLRGRRAGAGAARGLLWRVDYERDTRAV